MHLYPQIRRMLDSTLDSVVSTVVILLVVFGTIGLTLFLGFQVRFLSDVLFRRICEVYLT